MARESGLGEVFPELVDQAENLLLLFGGRNFESVDITAEQGRVEAELPGKTGDIDFLMGKEEPLYPGWFGFGVFETLETYVFIQFPPMDTDSAEFIMGAFLL